MANALWWVWYTDAAHPDRGEQCLSLSSPDLKDPQAAHKRARETAKERLSKKGIRARNLNSRCVG